jgi:hypothetical protein
MCFDFPSGRYANAQQPGDKEKLLLLLRSQKLIELGVLGSESGSGFASLDPANTTADA